MTEHSLIRRASRRCLHGLKRKLSRESASKDDRSSISQRSERSSFSTSSLFTTTTVEEDEYMPLDEPILEDPEKEPSPHSQQQSHFFARLPPEIRQQIYIEFWVACGVERHAFLMNRKLQYSPCITNHSAPDERQLGLAKEWDPSPAVQHHPQWFSRMASTWCNHWRCENLWKGIQDGHAIDFNRGKNQAFMALLVSCRRIYEESIESFQNSKVLNITNGHTLQRVIKYPRPTYLTEARTINISLREDSGNWLYLNGVSIWHILSEPEIKACNVYLWLDAECPLTRRLLPEFRELYTSIPASITPKLTIDFPCDAHDGFWAWGEVETKPQGGSAAGEVKTVEAFKPRFKVVARGRQRFNETSCGWVSSVDQGRPKPRVLGMSNPFEDIMLYGRGIHDGSYY